MRPWSAAPLLLVGLATGPLPAQLAGELTWHLPAGGIACGEPFEFTLAWRWPPAAAPVPVALALWGPLDCTLLAAEPAAGGGGERQRYRAIAWGAGAIELPPLVLRAVAGGAELAAPCAVPPLVVRSLLPDGAAAVEWPGLFAPAAGRAPWWWLGAAALLVLGGVGWWRRRRAPLPPPLVPSPAATALAALRALVVPGADAAPAVVQAFYTELAAIVRAHAGRMLPVPAATRTSHELLAAAAAGVEPLRDCLRRCDAVKFAADRPDAAAHGVAWQAAVDFVRAAAP